MWELWEGKEAVTLPNMFSADPPDPYKEIILNCLKENPEERPSLSDISEVLLFTDFEF